MWSMTTRVAARGVRMMLRVLIGSQRGDAANFESQLTGELARPSKRRARVRELAHSLAISPGTPDLSTRPTCRTRPGRRTSRSRTQTSIFSSCFSTSACGWRSRSRTPRARLRMIARVRPRGLRPAGPRGPDPDHAHARGLHRRGQRQASAVFTSRAGSLLSPQRQGTAAERPAEEARPDAATSREPNACDRIQQSDQQARRHPHDVQGELEPGAFRVSPSPVRRRSSVAFRNNADTTSRAIR
jgi:hypothetical protein